MGLDDGFTGERSEAYPAARFVSTWATIGLPGGLPPFLVPYSLELSMLPGCSSFFKRHHYPDQVCTAPLADKEQCAIEGAFWVDPLVRFFFDRVMSPFLRSVAFEKCSHPDRAILSGSAVCLVGSGVGFA